MPKLPHLLCAATIGSMTASRVIYQVGPYLSGRWGHDEICHQYELVGLGFLGVCLGFCILSAFALVAFFLNRLLLVRTLEKKGPLEALAIAALIASTFFFCFWTVQPANHYFLAGFKTCMEEHANLQEIQRWARTVKDRDGLIPETDWPPFVSDLTPSFVSVGTVEGNQEVSLTWGGGFFHWGLTLGDFSVSVSDPSKKRAQIMDDVSYVWVDSQ